MHCPELSSGIITAETWSVLFIRVLGRAEHRSFRLEKLPALSFCTNQDFIISPRDINETLACTASTAGATIFAAHRISEGRPAIWSAVLGFFAHKMESNSLLRRAGSGLCYASYRGTNSWCSHPRRPGDHRQCAALTKHQSERWWRETRDAVSLHLIILQSLKKLK